MSGSQENSTSRCGFSGMTHWLKIRATEDQYGRWGPDILSNSGTGKKWSGFMTNSEGRGGSCSDWRPTSSLDRD